MPPELTEGIAKLSNATNPNFFNILTASLIRLLEIVASVLFTFISPLCNSDISDDNSFIDGKNIWQIIIHGKAYFIKLILSLNPRGKLLKNSLLKGELTSSIAPILFYYKNHLVFDHSP